LKRRQCVAATAALAAAAAITCECCAAEAADAKDDKKGEKDDKNQPESKSVDAGPLKDYAKDGISDKFAKKPDRVMIVRHEGKLYAPSAICSHKRCTIKVKEGALACPCHGSKFTEMGVPTKGPAKSALLRYAVSKDDKGHVIVDKTKQFEEKDWESDGAFLKVE
jgi:cytochrome b6-f complex iron-sulfur subunit